MTDPYLYPGSTVLRNKRRITDSGELARAEAYFAEARLAAINDAGYARTFDEAHLRAIHRWLFGDLYDWAGDLRVGDYQKGSTQFWPVDTLATRLARVMESLVSGPLLALECDDEEFLNALSWLYLDLNYLHPFREGNGRAQRTFLSDIAAVSGRTVAWVDLDKHDNDEACERATQAQNPMLLRAVLDPLIRDTPERAREEAARDIALFRRWNLTAKGRRDAVDSMEMDSAEEGLIVAAITAGLDLTDLAERTAELARQRRDIVRTLRERGRSLDWIAIRLGISKSAVQQILRQR